MTGCIDVRMLFEFLRCKAGLTFYQTAYLLNVSPRTLKRWQNRDYPRNPPQDAIDVIKQYLDGEIPHEWADWEGHGVDMRTWKPRKMEGETNINAGLIWRQMLGARACAQSESTNS